MKRCLYCNRDLPENSGRTKCEKCVKNEGKYGKPTICKYCKLPAAFVDQKCVHCSYSERKHGPPIECHHCKLKSAFVRDPSKSAKVLCRMCQHKFGKTADSSFSKHKRPSTSDHASSSKKPRTETKQKYLHHHSSAATEKPRHSFTSNALGSILPTFSKNGASTFTPSTSGIAAMFGQDAPEEKIQQLREKIDEQQQQIADLNRQLREKQSRIVELEGEQHRKEKQTREKESQNQKLFDVTVGNLQDQIKQLNKELAAARKR